MTATATKTDTKTNVRTDGVKTTGASKADTSKRNVDALSAPVYTMDGKTADTISLPEDIFGAPWKNDLVQQVIVAIQANARTPIAHTKMRGEVRGGGKKPWKQKGTGRARHGSIRSPIWRGGGVTHGPRAERSFAQKINRKMRFAALTAVLSRKLKRGEIIFVDALSFKEPKTQKAKEVVQAIAKASGVSELSTRRVNAALIALSKKDFAVEKSFSNFGNLHTEEVRNLNPVIILSYRYLIIENPAEMIKALSARSVSAKKRSAV